MTTETKAEWTIDKTGWADGPWMREPDRLEWREPRGWPCLIVRNKSGALCGYVGVPPGHPWHGKDYSDCDVSIHGGLTFGQGCMEDGPVCHVPRDGESPEVWWLGFDCAHYMDFIPSYTKHDHVDRLWSQDGQTYRDLGYVRAEVERLAEQARAVR